MPATCQLIVEQKGRDRSLYNRAKVERTSELWRAGPPRSFDTFSKRYWLAARANAVGADGYVSKRHGVEKMVAMLTGILSELAY